MLGVNVPDKALTMSYDLLTRYANNQDTADVPAGQDLKNSMLTLATQMKAETDASYWARMTTFCHGSDVPTATDMMFFMQYTKELFPLTSQYNWTLYKADVVREIINSAQGGPALAFLPAYFTLPRAVAADCFELAFAGLANNITQ